MFVLVGQMLNARGRFGPMMWAPIANNVIAVVVLVGYLVTFGPARGAEQIGAFTGGQELLLGVGLDRRHRRPAAHPGALPARAPGFTFRPRFDFRGTGLGHTLRLGVWTVLFVLVNQIAYPVVVRLASGGTADGGDGTGYTVYSSTFLLVMVPHSIVTVSLATAILPLLSARAAAGDLRGLAHALAGAAHARWRWSSRSPRCCPSSPATSPGHLGPRRRRDHVRRLRARRWPSSAPGSSSSPSTTWCCAASTPSSRPARCSSSSARWPPPTSSSRWCWCAAPTPPDRAGARPGLRPSYAVGRASPTPC